MEILSLFAVLFAVVGLMLAVGLASFGFSLLIIESPYFKPIASWLEAKTIKGRRLSWLRDITVKGMRCYTCTSFWGGIFSGAFSLYLLDPTYNFGFWTALLGLLTLGCIGSGFSTLASYFMDWYLSTKHKAS